jgi:hypothetical protein
MINRYACLLRINSIWHLAGLQHIPVPDIVDVLGCERQAEQALVLLLRIAREILIHRTATRQAQSDESGVTDQGCLTRMSNPNFSIPYSGSKKFRIPDPDPRQRI